MLLLGPMAPYDGRHTMKNGRHKKRPPIGHVQVTDFKEVRTTTLATEQTSRTSFTPGGVQTIVIEENGPVELVSELTNLIQSKAAFSASAELLRTGQELQRELLDIKA